MVNKKTMEDIRGYREEFENYNYVNSENMERFLSLLRDAVSDESTLSKQEKSEVIDIFSSYVSNEPKDVCHPLPGLDTFSKVVELASYTQLKKLEAAMDSHLYHNIGAYANLYPGRREIIEEVHSPYFSALNNKLNGYSSLRANKKDSSNTRKHQRILSGQAAREKNLLRLKGGATLEDMEDAGMGKLIDQAVKALETNDLDSLKDAIGRGVPIEDYYVGDRREYSLLCLARSPEAAEVLLKAGANPDAHWQDESWSNSNDPEDVSLVVGISPLGVALANKRIDVAKVLLEYGANPNLQIGGWEDESTVLCSVNDASELRLLLEFGGDPKSGVHYNYAWDDDEQHGPVSPEEYLREKKEFAEELDKLKDKKELTSLQLARSKNRMIVSKNKRNVENNKDAFIEECRKTRPQDRKGAPIVQKSGVVKADELAAAAIAKKLLNR